MSNSSTGDFFPPPDTLAANQSLSGNQTLVSVDGSFEMGFFRPVVLLDDGNLVLRYGSSSSPPIWQSCDHPTHTYMPGSKLGYDKRTNTKQVLTSWKSTEDPAVGLFSLDIDQDKKQRLRADSTAVMVGQHRAFGVCNPQRSSCNCLIAFVPRSNNDWNLRSFSGGCVRTTEVNCGVIIEKPVFILSYVKKSFLSAFPENQALQLNESACRRSCLDNCICNAYTFTSNVCQHWNQENLNNISLGLV
ncbi:hypothetical protein L1987_06203 [Smallanthus sonchifolius]|uniref:Uncharacterized protein n=1 Tax=Smallanthus sonchifolius TaxID=185202 RepID=A0ACB9JXL4_9ASTR|nr:hypothetical protein L1987_06203 [Smallanthus sonchifolius]